eukprot:GHVH01006401.1.p1 GENE.GHVH01006401.1~~GHVH01006401.1.p1  ORF type:complete len:1237 (+),score=195.72 GHVH01006401.1:110-3820(+)
MNPTEDDPIDHLPVHNSPSRRLSRPARPTTPKSSLPSERVDLANEVSQSPVFGHHSELRSECMDAEDVSDDEEEVSLEGGDDDSDFEVVSSSGSSLVGDSFNDESSNPSVKDDFPVVDTVVRKVAELSLDDQILDILGGGRRGLEEFSDGSDLDSDDDDDDDDAGLILLDPGKGPPQKKKEERTRKWDHLPKHLEATMGEANEAMIDSDYDKAKSKLMTVLNEAPWYLAAVKTLAVLYEQHLNNLGGAASAYAVAAKLTARRDHADRRSLFEHAARLFMNLAESEKQPKRIYQARVMIRRALRATLPEFVDKRFELCESLGLKYPGWESERKGGSVDFDLADRVIQMRSPEFWLFHARRRDNVDISHDINDPDIHHIRHSMDADEYEYWESLSALPTEVQFEVHYHEIQSLTGSFELLKEYLHLSSRLEFFDQASKSANIFASAIEPLSLTMSIAYLLWKYVVSKDLPASLRNVSTVFLNRQQEMVAAIHGSVESVKQLSALLAGQHKLVEMKPSLADYSLQDLIFCDISTEEIKRLETQYYSLIVDNILPGRSTIWETFISLPSANSSPEGIADFPPFPLLSVICQLLNRTTRHSRVLSLFCTSRMSELRPLHCFPINILVRLAVAILYSSADPLQIDRINCNVIVALAEKSLIEESFRTAINRPLISELLGELADAFFYTHEAKRALVLYLIRLRHFVFAPSNEKSSRYVLAGIPVFELEGCDEQAASGASIELGLPLRSGRTSGASLGALWIRATRAYLRVTESEGDSNESIACRQIFHLAKSCVVRGESRGGGQTVREIYRQGSVEMLLNFLGRSLEEGGTAAKSSVLQCLLDALTIVVHSEARTYFELPPLLLENDVQRLLAVDNVSNRVGGTIDRGGHLDLTTSSGVIDVQEEVFEDFCHQYVSKLLSSVTLRDLREWEAVLQPLTTEARSEIIFRSIELACVLQGGEGIMTEEEHRLFKVVEAREEFTRRLFPMEDWNSLWHSGLLSPLPVHNFTSTLLGGLQVPKAVNLSDEPEPSGASCVVSLPFVETEGATLWDRVPTLLRGTIPKISILEDEWWSKGKDFDVETFLEAFPFVENRAISRLTFDLWLPWAIAFVGLVKDLEWDFDRIQKVTSKIQLDSQAVEYEDSKLKGKAPRGVTKMETGLVGGEGAFGGNVAEYGLFVIHGVRRLLCLGFQRTAVQMMETVIRNLKTERGFQLLIDRRQISETLKLLLLQCCLCYPDLHRKAW